MKKKGNGNTWTAEDRERWICETMAIIDGLDEMSDEAMTCSDIDLSGGYIGGRVIC